MGGYNDLKTAIAALIHTNDNQEITGATLQSALLSIINTIGQGSVFKGVATTSTNPGSPDADVFYIAGRPGYYPNFNLELTAGLHVIENKSGTWVNTKIALDVVDAINIGGAKHVKPSQAMIIALQSVEQIPDSEGLANKMWWSTDGNLKYKQNDTIYNLGAPAYVLYYCGNQIYKWTGSGFQEIGGGGTFASGEAVSNMSIFDDGSDTDGKSSAQLAAMIPSGEVIKSLLEIISSIETSGGSYDGVDLITTFSYDAPTRVITVKQSGRQAKTILLPLANSTNAGLMSSEDKTQLASLQNLIGKTVKSFNKSTDENGITITLTTYDNTPYTVLIPNSEIDPSVLAGKADKHVAADILTPSQWPRVMLYNVESMWGTGGTPPDYASIPVGSIYLDESDSISNPPYKRLFYKKTFEGTSQRIDLGAPQENTIYCHVATGKLYRWVPTQNGNDGAFQQVGGQSDIDLSQYATKNEVNAGLVGKVDKETGKVLIPSTDLAKLQNLPSNPVQSVTINGSTPAVGANGNVNLGTIVGQQGPQGPKGDRGDLNISEGATPTLSIISDMNTPDDEQDNIKVLSSGVGYNLGRAMLTAMELPTLPDFPVAGCTYYDPTASINARIKMYYIENNTLKHIDTTPSEQLIYCDMSTNTTYRFDGLEMVQIGGGSGGGISYTEDSTTIYVTSAGHVDPTPRISVSPTEISLSPVVGGTMTKTIIVRGYNLSQGITIALTDASGFYSINTQSLPAGGGNIVLTYHPTSAGTHNASLNISSGDASVAVSIVGVAASPTINVSSQSLTMRGASGSAVTASFRVTGVSLADDIAVAVSGSGFSVSPSTITAQQAVDGVDVAVTFDGSASTGNGTITLSSNGATSVQVAVTYAAIERLQEGDTITSYVGMVFTVLSDRQSVSVHASNASGAIVIPSVVQDSNGLAYDVTALDSAAFRNTTGITSIEIPASVTAMKTDNNGYSYAFAGCSNLTTAIIRCKCSIGSMAFQNCSRLASVQIDDGVTSIGGSAFMGCTALQSIVIPDSVTSLGSSLFGNSGLKFLQIGTSTECKMRTMTNALFNGGTINTSRPWSLEYVILYSTQIPSAGINSAIAYGGSLPPRFRNYDSSNEEKGANLDTNGAGRVYVPNSALNAYRTNAKDYTNAASNSENIFRRMNDINDLTGASGRIYAIEDIGTITGYENDALLTD